MDEISKTIEKMIRGSIPIARTMEIRVVDSDPHRMVLGAPLQGNHNDKGTAFAGSLYSLAVLCGWSYVNRILLDHGLKAIAMVADSTMKYLKPVRSDYQATCECRDDAAIEDLVKAVRTDGKGSINLETTVLADGVVAGRFAGRYVAKI